MSNFRPHILVFDDTAEKQLPVLLHEALAEEFSLTSVKSVHEAEGILGKLIPDCLILNLASSEVISILDHLRGKGSQFPILGFADTSWTAHHGLEIQVHSRSLLNLPEALRKTIKEAIGNSRS